MSIALRDQALRWIAALFACSVLLEWAVAIALMVVVYGASGSAAAAAGMLVCTQLVPNLVVAAFAGRLDAWAVRPVFIAATLVQAGGTLIVAALGYGITLYVAAVLIGTGSSVARAQLRAGVARADHGDGAMLRAGNAMLGLVRGPAGLLGPAAAGLAVGVLGAEGGLALFGAAQLALAASAVRAPRQRPRSISLVDEDACDAPPRSGRVLPVGFLLAMTAVVVCVFSVDEPVLLAYAEGALGSGAGGYSALFVAWGAGLMLGSVCFTRVLARPMVLVFGVGLLLNVVGHLGLVLAPTLPFALAAALIGGIGNGMDWSALSTIVQDSAPSGQEASVAGRLESIATIGCGAGIVIGGLVADQLGPRPTLLIPALGGAAVLAFVGAVHFRARPLRSLSIPSLSPSVQGGSL